MNGQLRGKRGGVVYYRALGQQVSRSRNFSPKNPKTFAQMIQRLFLANASKAAVGLKEIIDHSFEGVAYGSESVRHFQSMAQAALKAATPTTKGTTKICPLVPMDALEFPVANFMISSGTLKAPAYDVVVGAAGNITKLNCGNVINAESLAAVTVQQLCDALGVTIADQLTFVITNGKHSDGAANFEEFMYDNELASVVRVNFKQDAASQPAFNTSGIINTAVVVSEKSNNVVDLQFGLVGDTLSIIPAYEASAVGIIASRYENGAWRRSTSYLKTAAIISTQEFNDDQLEYYGWNYLDSTIKLLTGSDTAYEEYFLNKESNSGPSLG